LTRGSLKLVEWDQAFRFIPEVYDDVFAGDGKDSALENFVGGRRRKVAVILEEILVILDLPVVLVYGHCASTCHGFTDAADCRKEREIVELLVRGSICHMNTHRIAATA